MSLQWTATELTAKLQQFLEDDDLEFAGSIPDIINLGEIRVLRDLDLAMFSREQGYSTVVQTATITKPNEYLTDYQPGLRAITIREGGRNHMLELRSLEWINDYSVEDVGFYARPKYYAELDESTWVVAPVPDSSYSGNIYWTSRPTPLAITTNESNWLSDNVGDLLFKACLAESEQFLKSDDRIAIWKTDYAELLPRVKRELYPLINTRYPRVGAKPTLTPFGAD